MSRPHRDWYRVAGEWQPQLMRRATDRGGLDGDTLRWLAERFDERDKFLRDASIYAGGGFDPAMATAAAEAGWWASMLRRLASACSRRGVS